MPTIQQTTLAIYDLLSLSLIAFKKTLANFAFVAEELDQVQS
jgi:hypothetical protein